MAAATHMLKTRVTEETKRIIEAVARQQQLTESAWLRRLIATTLQTAGVTPDAASAEASEHARRAARLMIRLLAEDQLLLHARASTRGIPAATYVSVLVRSHLRGVSPLP